MSTEVITQQLTSLPLVGSSEPKPKSKSTRFEDQGFTSPVKIQFADSHEEREYIKGRLTAAFRIFGHFCLNEGAAGHISVRDPIDSETFWVNPFGLDFNLINKSDLIRVNHKGEVLNHGRIQTLNKAAFIIHAAIHAARPDVLCAAHTHSIYGRAFCSLGRPLDMLTLDSCLFYNDHVVFDGRGVVLAEDEGEDIARSLGGAKAALLRNHGLLTVGQTIEEAVQWFYTLDSCCHVQLLADAAAHGRGEAPNLITDEEAEFTRAVAGTPKAGWFGGNMLFELIDKITNKDYLQ